MKTLIVLFSFLILPSLVFAAPITACHCFKDRSFDAANPGKSDPYLLATTQNSFLSAVFNINKSYVVKTKMSGGSGSDLWISLYIAQKTGLSSQVLISERKTTGSWKSVVSQKKIKSSILGQQFKTALSSGVADELLAGVVADQMLVTRLNAKQSELKRLRDRGATTKEVILSTFLSLKSGRNILDHYVKVTKGKSTWDIQLSSIGIRAKDVGLEIKKIIKK